MPEKLHTRYRYAKREDAGAIAELFATSWKNAYCGIIPYQQLNATIHRRDENWWKTALSKDRNPILMMVDDQIIGYATICKARDISSTHLSQHVGEITELYLDPDYQGVGFGRQLFSAAWSELKKSNLNELIVWALSDNNKACDFYENLGGQKFAKAHDQFGKTRLEKTAFKWRA